MKLKKYGVLVMSAASILTLAACTDEDKDKDKTVNQLEVEDLEKVEVENYELQPTEVDNLLSAGINNIASRDIEHMEGYKWFMKPEEVNELMVKKVNKGLLKENIKIEHFNVQGDNVVRHTYKDTLFYGLSDLDVTYEFHNNIRFEKPIANNLLTEIVVTFKSTDLEEVKTNLTGKLGEPNISEVEYIAYDLENSEVILKKSKEGAVVLTVKVKPHLYDGLPTR